MFLRLGIPAGALLIALFTPPVVLAQTNAPQPARTLNEHQIRELLVFNSPWESRATTPGHIYRYRTSFVIRGGELVAQVMRYATNEQGDSVVTMNDGRLAWQDTDGAKVAVAVQGEELVGTAALKSGNLNIVFKPRP